MNYFWKTLFEIGFFQTFPKTFQILFALKTGDKPVKRQHIDYRKNIRFLRGLRKFLQKIPQNYYFFGIELELQGDNRFYRAFYELRIDESTKSPILVIPAGPVPVKAEFHNLLKILDAGSSPA